MKGRNKEHEKDSNVVELPLRGNQRVTLDIPQLDKLSGILRENAKKEEGNKSKGSSLPLLVTVILAIMGYLVTWTLTYLDTQKEQLRSNIERKIQVYQEVASALMNVREIRLEIEQACEYNPKLRNDRKAIYEANARRLKANSRLANTGFSSAFAFGYQWANTIWEFNSWDEQTKNVCDRNTPNDDDYRARQVAIQKGMRQIITEEQKMLANNYNLFSGIYKNY